MLNWIQGCGFFVSDRVMKAWHALCRLVTEP
jgi:hypothetical protein